MKKLHPALIFSKGGFVSVPVIIAAKSLKISILIHESDMTPGLANKISQRFAPTIFTSFEETVNFFPADRTVAIGSPIRKEILSGSKSRGKQLLGFNRELPILTIRGGILGAKKINDTVRCSLKKLLKSYQIVHICGKGNIDKTVLAYLDINNSNLFTKNYPIF